jgi:glycosyltransferase involved in cell wall biosynthesis
MLVQTKNSDDSTVIGPGTSFGKGMGQARPVIDRLPLEILHRKRSPEPWTVAWLPGTLLKAVRREKPDLVHLHWIGGGMASIPQLARLPCPVVWTHHDMWGFTGGCHYAGECVRYRSQCGSCPQLRSTRSSDLSRWIQKRKEKHWSNIPLTNIAPSRWMEQCVSVSRIFKNFPVHRIPYCIDLKRYKPAEKMEARKLLNLPPDKKLILFGAVNAASDVRKGFQFLHPTLRQLSEKYRDGTVELVVFGASASHAYPDMGFKTHFMGTLSDDVTLVLLYSAADIFLAPSLQDNLPNTVLEATACGTPSVAFNIGGMSDLIGHRETGYLAKPFSIDDLGSGIQWMLQNEDRYRMLSHNARAKAEQEYSPEIVAEKHINLYHDVVHHQRG